MFKDPSKEDAYRTALTMHDTLSKEGSGRGIAYRKGWNGHPYDKSWGSYPIYAAGRTNRRKIGGEDLLPVGTTHFRNQERKP
jgi:hypothetical protein